jgi:hypothetical protein
VTILEGRYKGKDADVSNWVLGQDEAAKPAASCKFDITKGQLFYGSNGPVDATTQNTNPTPIGKHDIEIPDFQHSLGSKYGDYATTWFRLGHGGDRYLHPGRVSLGCTTCKDISKWPDIWAYLIKSRKDDQSVGELEVVADPAPAPVPGPGFPPSPPPPTNQEE